MAFEKFSNLFKEETVEITQEEMQRVEKEVSTDGLDDAFKIDSQEKVQSPLTRSVVKVYEPVTKSIVPTIIDSIKRGELVIVNLSKLPEDEAQYIFSTLSGSIYSLDGELKTIADQVMLCAPQKFVVDYEDAN